MAVSVAMLSLLVSTLRYWRLTLVPLFLFASVNSVAAQTLCADVTYLIEQSRSQFSDITGDPINESGELAARFVLPEAWRCSISVDIEKAAYVCSWKFPHATAQARSTYERFVAEIRACIGHVATENQDQSVNHPDFYELVYYALEDGEVSVTLKNKSKMRSTFVSIGVDGFTTQ